MTDTSWKFYLTAEDAWESMYADCEAAEKSILLEQYIFTNDTVIGKRLIDLLIKKAKQGIEVRLLLDGAGSYLLSYSHLITDLRAVGAEVIFFKPISIWRAYNYVSWFFRDHRKLMIVDSKIGHTGGVGINGRMRDWRDTHVRIEGSVVAEMEEAFYNLRSRQILRRPRRYPRAAEFSKAFHYVTNAPHYRRRYLYQSLIEHIRSAKDFIYVTSPYFIPDSGIFRALRLASKRGVDVRIITPLVSDHMVVDLATYSYFGVALRSGMRIYTYAAEVLHAKTVVIDGEWSSVGSANLDNLSLLFNYEGNIVSTDRDFAQTIKEQFLTDVNHSLEIRRHLWRHRPRWQKIAEVLTWPFHRIL